MSDEETCYYCPKCGKLLKDYDPLEGAWCEKCKDWLPPDFIEENQEEDYDEEDED